MIASAADGRVCCVERRAAWMPAWVLGEEFDDEHWWHRQCARCTRGRRWLSIRSAKGFNALRQHGAVGSSYRGQMYALRSAFIAERSRGRLRSSSTSRATSIGQRTLKGLRSRYVLSRVANSEQSEKRETIVSPCPPNLLSLPLSHALDGAAHANHLRDLEGRRSGALGQRRREPVQTCEV